MSAAKLIGDPDFYILKRQFLNFFEKEPFYVSEIERQIEKGVHRLIINLNDLRIFDLDLAQNLIQTPIKLIPPLEAAVFELANSKGILSEKSRPQAVIFKVGFEGSFGENFVMPRGMRSSLLTKLVSIEGIATKLSLVRPKRSETVHYCDETKHFSSMVYRDATNFEQGPTSSSIPVKDADGHSLSLEYGYSTYVDHQKIYVQDMPERSAAGQMPQNVEVIVENDLVDSCKAGDRVQIIGVYRALAWKASGTTSGFYRTVLIANNIKVIRQIGNSHLMTEKDIKNIRRISKRQDIFDLFAKSIVPSLYGHEIIKKATLMLLLGGEEKILENKTHIRGDINMLLLGDPSVGKSQLLRAIMQIAKLSVSTTGKGSTGVGLTAAVLKDRDTGDRYLEAGATVLADRGVICIDEFDKMSEMDRTAIHEVMEQQTVTIAKAGIHTSLNARCSVVAAANPVYSSYDSDKSPQQNIPLPDSILSRFDVLFIVLDKLDPETDRKISDHVLRMHRYDRPMGTERDFFASDGYIDDVDDDEEETQVFERFNRLLHDTPYVQNEGKRKKTKNDFLTVDFIKKYIEYAKSQFHPVLTEKANETISRTYCDIRNRDVQMTLPITARYVETIIRFATAHAKLRLSNSVKVTDVHAILNILYHSLGIAEETKDPESDSSVDAEIESVSEKENKAQTAKKRKKRSKPAKSPKLKEKPANVESPEKADLELEIMETISSLTEKDSKVDIEQVVKELKRKGKMPSDSDVRKVLAKLEALNRIMCADGVIYKI